MNLKIILLGLFFIVAGSVGQEKGWLFQTWGKAQAGFQQVGHNFNKVTTIRGRDETGHRTGLGTLAKSFVSSPRQTVGAIRDFSSSYNQMKKDNLRGGNLAAHENANYKATMRTGNPKLAGAISAFREQSKNHRTPVSSSAHARKGWGDMRTPGEIKSTMDANRAGRERAMRTMG